MLSGYFSYLIITDYNGELAKYVLKLKFVIIFMKLLGNTSIRHSTINGHPNYDF